MFGKQTWYTFALIMGFCEVRPLKSLVINITYNVNCMNKAQIQEKRKIKKDIKTRIGKGEPKQKILEELSQLYKDKATIMKQLEVTPSKVMKYECRMLNYLLAGLLLTAMILDSLLLLRLEWGSIIIDANSILNVVLDAVFLVGVLLFRIENYSWIAARAVVTLVTITVSYAYYHIPINILIFISFSLIVASFILGLLLGVKLCPQRIPKVVEVNIDGIEKINKTIYVFPD